MTLGELMDRNHEIGYKEGHESGLREGRESGLREGRESGLREGRELGFKETARKMKHSGISVEIIIECTGLTEKEIRDLN